MGAGPSSRPGAEAESTPEARLAEGGLAGIVGYQLVQATIVTNAVFERQVGTPHGIRPVEFTILQLIQENPDVSATQLARALAMTAPNVKLWLDRLQSRGFVQRAPNALDRRAQHLRVTREGKAMALKATRLIVEGEAQALTALSLGERTILIELLHKLARCRDARRRA